METGLSEDQAGRVSLPRACCSEPDAFDFIESVRWGGGVACPRCAGASVYKMTDRLNGARNGRYLWRCRGCGRQFTVRLGTMFEDSAIELHKWCRGLWEVTRTRSGTTPSQLARVLRITPKSAASMLRRFSAALAVGRPEVGVSHGPKESAGLPGGARLSVPLEWMAAVACVVGWARRSGTMDPMWALGRSGEGEPGGIPSSESLMPRMPLMNPARTGRARIAGSSDSPAAVPESGNA